MATANRNHLDAADRILNGVVELRQITNRNVDGAKATLTSTSGLADRARQLGEIMDGIVGANGNQDPHTTAKPRSRRAKKITAQNNQSE
jgi:hypothetical protein